NRPTPCSYRAMAVSRSILPSSSSRTIASSSARLSSNDLSLADVSLMSCLGFWFEFDRLDSADDLSPSEPCVQPIAGANRVGRAKQAIARGRREAKTAGQNVEGAERYQPSRQRPARLVPALDRLPHRPIHSFAEAAQPFADFAESFEWPAAMQSVGQIVEPA